MKKFIGFLILMIPITFFGYLMVESIGVVQSLEVLGVSIGTVVLLGVGMTLMIED